MEDCISSAGEYGKYQKIIIFISITTGSIPFILSISYAYLTKMPSFLAKDSLGQYTIETEFDNEIFCSNDNNDYIKDKKNSVDNFTYEFDLYCNKEFFLPLYSTVFFFRGAIGLNIFRTHTR